MTGVLVRPAVLWAAAATFAAIGALLLPLPAARESAAPPPAALAGSPRAAPSPDGSSTRASAPPPDDGPARAPALPTASVSPRKDPPPSDAAVPPNVAKDTARTDWQPVVRGFTADFTRPDDDLGAWPAQISRWTTPHLTEQLTSTDPRLLPTGPPRDLQTLPLGDAVDFLARYDDEVLVAGRAERGADGWAVVTVEPAGLRNSRPEGLPPQ